MVGLRQSGFLIGELLLKASDLGFALGLKVLLLDEDLLKLFQSNASVFSGINALKLGEVELTGWPFLDMVVKLDVRVISFFQSLLKLSHDLLFCHILRARFLVQLQLDPIKLQFLSLHHH